MLRQISSNVVRRTPALVAQRTAALSTQARVVDYEREEQRQERGESRNWRGRNAAAAAVGAVAAVAVAAVTADQARADGAANADVEALRADIVALLDNERYDDGSYGPVLVRLAWHACGTYDKSDGSGGSDGATMRFEPEAAHGANAGLDVARTLLRPLVAKYPGVSVSDLWQFAAIVAIEEMGGPRIPFRFGRVDKPDGSHCTPDGRLPDAAQGASHMRDIFYRMGFNDQEITALVGAHALGRCHTNRSGFDGPWTRSPIMFTNDFYTLLLGEEWKVRQWNGPKQYQDAAKELMMLPSDMAFLNDPSFRIWVERYAADEDLFFRDFSKAFNKLQENGVKKFAKPWYQFW
eukprot:TRINITY_DN193_c0_g1_i4.p2 TRINITY_DN193_c0_g1~~TRINITY_DN193_c0_g1_i4.p2  ORF type:complete len:350 (-),score=203.64 TRINITY_DN193_c0_g1_i4:60-1109(-)